jgi:undecaprenyl pyrophosphate phosphatase UppP
MNDEFREGVPFKPWGPLISPTYENEPITKADIVVASAVWALTLVNVVIALWQVSKQTKTSRSPLKSVYVWMIWLELIVSFVMGLECFLHLLKLIPPSKLGAFILQRIPLTMHRLCLLLYDP